MRSAVILYNCILTAVQNHLDTRRESIDASFDGVKEFLIGMNDRGAEESQDKTLIKAVMQLRYS